MKNLLMVVLAVSIFTACSMEKSEEDKKLTAYRYAEGFVKQRLKSPSTAEFPNFMDKHDHVNKRSESVYDIKSWVDSQNGFGATVRMKFSCTITYVGDKVKVSKMKIN